MRLVTQLLRDGYLGDVTTLRGLQMLSGLTTDERAAEALMISPETFRRWRGDRRANPTAIRLLAVLAGYVPWPTWADWEIHNGYLFPPGWSRRGILPGEVLALPYLRELNREYKRQLQEVNRQQKPQEASRHGRAS